LLLRAIEVTFSPLQWTPYHAHIGTDGCTHPEAFRHPLPPAALKNSESVA
jgi:hypothetical protein